MTLKMFIGGFNIIPFFDIDRAPPKYMIQANLEFLQEAMNYSMPKRTNHFTIDINLIHSGDFLGVVRLDGIDQIVSYGTGSRIGHCAMAM